MLSLHSSHRQTRKSTTSYRFNPRNIETVPIFDFSLSDDDMAQIATLNQADSGFINFGDPNFVKYLIENYG